MAPGLPRLAKTPRVSRASGAAVVGDDAEVGGEGAVDADAEELGVGGGRGCGGLGGVGIGRSLCCGIASGWLRG